jgi:hypothetical protein
MLATPADVIQSGGCIRQPNFIKVAEWFKRQPTPNELKYSVNLVGDLKRPVDGTKSFWSKIWVKYRRLNKGKWRSGSQFSDLEEYLQESIPVFELDRPSVNRDLSAGDTINQISTTCLKIAQAQAQAAVKAEVARSQQLCAVSVFVTFVCVSVIAAYQTASHKAKAPDKATTAAHRISRIIHCNTRSCSTW